MNISKTFFIIALFLCLSFTSWGTTIHLVYESGFSNEFITGEWAGVDSATVKSTILSRVGNDFDDFSINVSEATGDIKVYIGRYSETYFGLAESGIGSLFYDANPYAEVYTNMFASFEEWQGDNATAARIAKALAGITSHEVGHLLNLYHAFMWDAYDPTGDGVREPSLNFPREPDLIDEYRIDEFEGSSDSVYYKYMVTSAYITLNQVATIDREFSDYSIVSLNFGLNGGGTVTRNFIWGLRDTSFDEHPYNVTSDVTINSDVTFIMPNSTTLSFNSGKRIEVNGELDSYGGVSLTKEGVSNWNGIYINYGGTFKVSGDNVVIEYASTGLRLNDSGTFYNYNGVYQLSIQNCSPYGLVIDDASPSLRNINVYNSSDDGVNISGTGTGPTMSYVTVEGSGSEGIWINNGDANITYSWIEGNTYQPIFLYNSNAGLFLGDSENNGYNNIVPYGVNKAIDASGCSATIDAYNNWWGTDSPTSSLFNNNLTVNYYSDYHLDDYYMGAGAQKIATPPERNLLAEAWMSEEAGNVEMAYEKYKLALQEQTSDESRRKCIKAMIRTQDHSTKQYDEIASLIATDREKATGSYVAVLDYLKCTLPMKTGDIRGSVALFEEKARLWSGVPMGEEMNCRLAVLYGRNLGDKDTGRRYADAVAAINPGCRFLENAYDACGVEYDPTKFEDRSINYKYAEKPAALEDPLAEETIEPSVAVSPNPANPATTIHYSIAETSRVTLSIYSVTGQKVATLVDGVMPAGRHSVVFDGSDLASGVYFYRLESPGFAKTGKMLLVK